MSAAVNSAAFLPSSIHRNVFADDTDGELLAAIAARDQGAMAALYRRYERRIFRFALSILRDRCCAEDVVIDTLHEVWRSAGHFAAQSRASTWILGIARHKALDQVRRMRRVPHGGVLEQDSDPNVNAQEDSAPSPADCADAADQRRLVSSALQALSELHREVLCMAFFEDLPYLEIARRLGVPQNTVKTRVYHAKLRLLQQLAARGDPALSH